MFVSWGFVSKFWWIIVYLSVWSYGSSLSLLFMTKVMVWQFVSDTHTVLTALCSCCVSFGQVELTAQFYLQSIFIEFSLQSCRYVWSFPVSSHHKSGWIMQPFLVTFFPKSMTPFHEGSSLFLKAPLFLLFCAIESWQRVSVGFEVDLSFRSIFVLKNAFDKNTPEKGQINLKHRQN